MGTGDQIISILVETPSKLISEQRELFEKLAELEENIKKSGNPMSRGFFEKLRTYFTKYKFLG